MQKMQDDMQDKMQDMMQDKIQDKMQDKIQNNRSQVEKKEQKKAVLPVQMPELLLAWYDKGRRILPWREEPSPYHVWLSEIMLQQTRVEAVREYYRRFLEALPDIASLAGAEEDRLLKLWEGLGYYNRVRNLQKAARIVMENYQGKVPSDTEELMKLPGIGSYTAGAVASIAYGKKAPAVDGNVLRVYARLMMDGGDILQGVMRRSVEQAFSEVMPKDRPGDFNQSLMELGAMTCIPNGAPKCGECPLEEICLSHQNGCEMNFPVKTPKKPRQVEEKTILIMQSETRTAIRKRPDHGLLAGLYEFPSLAGRLSAEKVVSAVKESGLSPLYIRSMGETKHIFTHREWQMTGYYIRIDELSPVAQTAEKLHYMFVDKNQIEKTYPIPSAYAFYLKQLKGVPAEPADQI